MRSRLRGLTLVLALLVGVAGCGDDGGYDAGGVDPRFKDYCAVVSAQQKPITEALAGPQAAALITALPSFERLRAKAPSDIAADWAIVVDRVTALRDALDAAGVAPADYDPKKTPKALDAADRRAIEQAAAALATPEMAASLQAVQQQSRDVCKTSLGFS